MRRLTKALLGIGVALGLLGLIELGLRLTLGPPPPPVKVYRVKEALDGYISEVEPGVGVLTYQKQSANPSFTKVADRPRFVVLGGSSVHQGTRGIRADRQFPGLLAEATGYEVLNLGAPAFDSHDIAAIVEEALAWDLSGVVIYAGHNDIGNTWFFTRYASAGSRAEAMVLSVLENFQIYCQLRRLVDGATFIEGDPRQNARDHAPTEAPRVDRGERHAAALKYYERNLRRIAFMCRKEGVALVLVTPVSNALTSPNNMCTQPPECAMDYFQAAQQAYYSDPVQAEAWYRTARELDEVPVRASEGVVDAMKQVAADEEGVILVDAEALLPKEQGMGLTEHTLFQDHMHFTAEGQQEMARILEPALRQVVEGTPGSP